MAPKTAQKKTSPKQQSGVSSTSSDETRERIQRHFGDKNFDALRDDAVGLANNLEGMRQQVGKLSAYQNSLREKLEAMMAHEHYSVIITDVLRNGSLVAEVAGLGGSRVQVGVHPDIDPEELLIGATGTVSRERNCLLKVTGSTGRWNDVGTFEKCLDSPGRILIRDRELLLAVDVAHQLRGVKLKNGDLVGFDRELGMAYQQLEAPNNDHLFDEDVTDDFAQLGGLDKQIARIQRHVDFRFRFPELAAKYSLKNKCGILLKGAPGNGKTRIARCCAGYVRQLFPDRPCRFMHVAGASDYSKWFGETEQKIIQRFNAVREAAADGLVIMFWDEIDAIGKQRGTDYGSGAPARILNTFLSQIDGVVPLGNVIILYATNLADTLDPGLLRPGRTDEKIDIPTPNRQGAAAILRCYLGQGIPLAGSPSRMDDPIQPLLSRLFAPNGEYAEVAHVKLSDGRRLPVAGRQLISGAMLEHVVDAAAQQAAVREAETGTEGLSEEDLAVALESELIGAVSLLAPANVKLYVKSIPQDAQPIAVEPILKSSTFNYVRSR